MRLLRAMAARQEASFTSGAPCAGVTSREWGDLGARRPGAGGADIGADLDANPAHAAPPRSCWFRTVHDEQSTPVSVKAAFRMQPRC